MTQTLAKKKQPAGARLAKWWARYWQLTLMLLLPFCFVALFSYGPMYGLQIAFKKFKAIDGIWGSKWVGFDQFIKFFNNYQFWSTLRNTVTISLYSLIAGFPIPILLAVSLNCCNNLKFKKAVQLVTYAPHFISTVVMVAIIIQILGPKYGLVNNVIKALGGEPVMFMATGKFFYHIYVWSGIWQGMGWSAIIYISALSGVDPSLHEAAIVDGASRVKRIWHIDLPGIAPTIIILLIMNAGSIMSVGYEKVYLMQNSTNTDYSEVISTLVYKIGLKQSIPNYSYSTAIGLFNNIVNFIMLVLVNFIAGKVSETSLW